MPLVCVCVCVCLCVCVAKPVAVELHCHATALIPPDVGIETHHHPVTAAAIVIISCFVCSLIQHLYICLDLSIIDTVLL